MRRTATALSAAALLLGLAGAMTAPANAASLAAAPKAAANAASGVHTASNYWDGKAWTVSTNGARLRTKPQTGSVIGQLYPGDEIKIISHHKSPGWDKIKVTKSRGGLSKGTVGYIHNDNLDVPTCFPETPQACNAW
uniref:SH3 domain-containing protein n=1 Tax=Streptomyces sp. NBC_00003 TaxID=2903608 RepID=A0AAU2UXD1_9ACTN